MLLMGEVALRILLALAKLFPILNFHYNLVKKVGGNITELRKELTTVEGLIKDIAKQNPDSHYLEGLVQDMKSFFDDAEDVEDTYKLRAAVQKSRSRISKTFHFIDYHLNLWGVGKNTQKISGTIKEFHLGKTEIIYKILKNGDKFRNTAEPEHGIELKYKHLPNHLKLCFLYLGVFPKDFEIPVWKLVRLWMAEGFIRQEESTSELEDIAEKYLDELVSINLVTVGHRRSNGKMKTCTVHDAQFEFCKNQAKQEKLFQEIKKDSLSSFLTEKSALDQHRRLCINKDYFVDFISSPPPGKCIRSLLTFAKEETDVERKHVSTIPKTFRHLRILEIQAFKFPRFPIDLNHFVLLKYIAISSKFSSLPKTMSTLWNMQTLIVNTESTTLEIKADIWKLPQLRHLHTNTSALLPCPDSKNQKKKNEVIQTLSTISPESCTREILGRTVKLKKLGIRGTLTKLFEISGGSPLFDNLKDLASLENLKLVNDNFESSIASLPSENSFPQQLTNLSLSGTQLDWREIAKLGKLENLEILKLKERAFQGTMWQTAHGGFLQLKHLHVGTTDLEDWEASADHFPELKCLELNGCDKLKAVPAGFSDISSLQSVNLHSTNTLVVSSAKKLQAEKDKKSPDFKLSVYPLDHLNDNARI